MTYGLPVAWDLHGDWRVHLVIWAAYLLVAALEMRALTALRPFSLWAPLLLFSAVDSLTTQPSGELWLTYSLAFLMSCGVNLLLDCLR